MNKTLCKDEYKKCFNRLDKYVFSKDMAVKDDWYCLLNYHKQQLQAYKDKEDKIRELVKDCEDEQTKTYQKILQVQQNEIDQLERNCDVFYEQMNDAVERTVELNKEKKDLKEWLEEEIEEANQLASVGDNYMRNAHELMILAFKEVLERLG